ncbi:VPLPA-CTERM sorting domain-containing protein [Methylomonas koyamae]|uniref:VPLPA-CTERM sorting domain-containing protein n=1 Tax=Methylomonas koyamae TaxID=702114 RepID=UPI001129D8C1|nr:VPLPA-CTERM sorting domain-containing protein [Methylomonas koyamae]TPQ29031.1 hypothetical protein C2U68_03495 [Methylomonas koyamae]
MKSLGKAWMAGMTLSLNMATADAALFDRGGGLIYDDALNVTWLQDANYAKTSGYDADGLMTWQSAKTWAENLVFHDSVRNVDYSDWRLPGVSPVNGISFNYDLSNDGSTDRGYNITSSQHELAYMYSVNLGLKSQFNASGVAQSDYGIFGNGTWNGFNQNSWGQNNIGLINNLQAYAYWSGGEWAPNSGNAWDFATFVGYQSASPFFAQEYVWAVRDGDVTAVPLPGAMWLMGAGLIGLSSLKRRLKAA